MGFSPVSWSFCMSFCMKYDTLFDFWWSLALGSKQNGQSKAFWYYQAVKRHLWRFLWGCLVEIVPPLLIVWEVFFHRYASKEICLSASCMSSLGWNNTLLLSLVIVVFVCPRWSSRVSERWNWLRKDSGLNSLRRLCCYGQSSSSCSCSWCYLVNVLVPACLLPTFLTLRHSWDQQRSMYWNSDFH